MAIIDPQFPRNYDLMAAGAAGLVDGLEGEAKAKRAHHAFHGVYSWILKGWLAQAGLVRRRFMREVAAHRLGQSFGPALRELVQSEYRSALEDTPTKAVGEADFTRTVVNTSSSMVGNFTPSVVEVGTKFRRDGNDSYPVPLQSAEFEVTKPGVTGRDDSDTPIDVGDGRWKHLQRLHLEHRSTRDGTHANMPIFLGVPAPEVVFTGPLAQVWNADDDFPSAGYAAGGSGGLVDEQLEAMARALAVGFDGSTASAALAGCFADPGTRHVAGFLDAAIAVLGIYPADASWASSTTYGNQVLQRLKDYPWLGFGCRAATRSVMNQGITVNALIMLRDRRFLSDTTALSDSIRESVLRYFDDRPNWWTWRSGMIKSAIVNTDKRIIRCQTLEVLDHQTHLPLSEPAAIVGSEERIVHFHLVGQGVDLTYTVQGG